MKYKKIRMKVAKGWEWCQQVNEKGELLGIGSFQPFDFKPSWKQRFNELRKGFGFCLICNSLDLDILEEHHVTEDFTITLCPNCHRRLHLYQGKEAVYNWKKR